MKSIFYIFFIFTISVNVSASEIYCKFEEVYKDGSIQNGFFIIKNDGMRYQYENKELYTLFFKNSEFFIVNHSNNKNFQKINQNTDLIKELFNLYQKYPNIKNEYSKNNLFIRLEPSLEKIFYKRISISSESLDISIYLNDCQKSSFHQRYYNYSPYFEFKN